MRSRLLIALGLVVAVGILVRVEAQRGGGRRGRQRLPETSQILESVTSLRCEFPTASTATWEDGEPRTQSRKAAQPAVLTISKIDAQDGSAEMGGGFRGGDHVIVKLAGSTLHFLDMSLNGTLAVATVFARETHDGRLQAVSSRASYAPGSSGGSTQPEMSQYYGDCEVGR